MKRLFSYMMQRKKESILAPLFKMLEATFELIIPLIVADMIDQGVGSGNAHRIIASGLLMVLLGFIGLAFSVTAQYFAAKSAINCGTKIRSDLFRHINTLSYAEIDQLGTATLITRMTSDINQVQNGVNMCLRLLLRSPFVVLGAMIMAFTVDVHAATVFLIVIPVLFVVVFGILLGTRPLYKKVQNQLDLVMLRTRENLTGVRVVRAFNRQTAENAEFADASTQLYQKQLYVGKISALLNPITYVIINLGIIGILYKGGVRVNAGDLSQGQVIALVNYMSQILVELVKLANLIILLSKAAACMNRIDTIFEMKSTVTAPERVNTDAAPATGADFPVSIAGGAASSGSGTSASQPCVSFEHVSFCYGSSTEPAIEDISFSAAPGQTIGIIGGTGSGKSTLVNLIPRFYDCSGGSVKLDGLDVRSLDPEEIRKKVGIVPQKAMLFKGTVRSNLAMGNPNAGDEEMYRALDIAQAREFIEAKGHGLDLISEQEGRNFSGGQKQRLTIARALVRNPEILILDDSASALDFATDAHLRKAIRQSTSSMTVFLVSQRVSTVRNADEILVLEDGHLSGHGSHLSLLKTCPVYREICESQLSRAELENDLKKGGIRA